MRKGQRNISDLGHSPREEYERDIRIAFEEVANDSDYLYLDRIKNTQDVATLPGFSKKRLQRVVLLDDFLLISPYDTVDRLTRREAARGFGRTFRDWATLIAWNFDGEQFHHITPGLSFCWDNRSYELDVVSHREEEHKWTLKYSEPHKIHHHPMFNSKTMDVEFSGRERDFYLNLFVQLPGNN